MLLVYPVGNINSILRIFCNTRAIKKLIQLLGKQGSAGGW